MMPVERLPAASWPTALGLGFISAVFDNIPLTKLALEQGGYDWGVLAYAVGFGGSMIWFGSSAGVAITNLFPEARSVGDWLQGGWHVILAYVVGFAAVMLVMGWQPHAPHKSGRGRSRPRRSRTAVDHGAEARDTQRGVRHRRRAGPAALRALHRLPRRGGRRHDATCRPGSRRWTSRRTSAARCPAQRCSSGIAAMAPQPLDPVELQQRWLDMFERWDEMFDLAAGPHGRVPRLPAVEHRRPALGRISTRATASARWCTAPVRRTGSARSSRRPAIYRKAESMFGARSGGHRVHRRPVAERCRCARVRLARDPPPRRACHARSVAGAGRAAARRRSARGLARARDARRSRLSSCCWSHRTCS